jgi:hypothetical protein
MQTVFQRAGWELVGTSTELSREWRLYEITRQRWQADR